MGAGYTKREAAMAAAAAERIERYKAEVARLRGAIVEHYRQIHQHNWGHDDLLWAEVGLVADAEVIG